ncbi:MAG: tRNA (N(6)-L-threonylcarbamoyladenosine(37)-C(2))-methylthiotransferase MtaB [Clostridiaceae bacterium]|nr:tRNA (N(6)-L-threonylcarbamoyladenosine(37)-C(2))-methylthiotransferase MtaB [Clostridiaceae bacterium]
MVDLRLGNDEFYRKYGRKKRAGILTLGCKVNQYESEAISGMFENAGYEIVDFGEKADVYVINTCTVTGISARKSRQMISRARKNNKNAIIAVVGCYPQVAPEEVIAIPGVNLIMGTRDRDKLMDHIGNIIENLGKDAWPNSCKINAVNDIKEIRSFEKMHVENYRDRTRAYLKIQDGCTQFCSYCIIPYARGTIRSREPRDVIAEVKKLASNGYKEVVLTGIHVASYGKDLKNTSLLDIICRVHEIEGIERIRLSSVEPTIITAEFVNTVKQLGKLCPHYHISLQSGCDDTLKRMNRRYTTSEYKNIVDMLRSNIDDVSITTDVMVGFPGETDQEFEQTYNFVEGICFSKMHVFRFSPRKGTPAYSFKGQVPDKVKEERSNRLIELSMKCSLKFHEAFVGRTMPVLFEQESDRPRFFEGLTPNYIRVLCELGGNIKGEDLTGEIKNVVLKEAREDFMIAGMDDSL